MRTTPLACLLAMSLVTAACSPGEEAADSTTTTMPPTATTSHAPSTTTTTAATTTTTSLAQSTTTTTLATTTTTVAGVDIELSDEGIQVGSDWLPFGSDDDETVAALTAALGPASDDTGWLDALSDGWERFGVCPQPNVRGVSWGEDGDISLQVLFTDGDTDFWVGGVQHLFAFYYSDSSPPHGLNTPEGIGVGSSLGELNAVYEPAKIVIEEAWFDPALGYWSYDMHDWTGMWGFATGQGDADTITSLNGGRGCGE